MKTEKKDLVQIIKDNPGCIAVIDNDSWSIQKLSSSDNPFAQEEEEGYSEKADKWEADNILARDSDDLVSLGEGYGSGCCYGGDILQALAVIVGIKIESV